MLSFFSVDASVSCLQTKVGSRFAPQAATTTSARASQVPRHDDLHVRAVSSPLPLCSGRAAAQLAIGHIRQAT